MRSNSITVGATVIAAVLGSSGCGSLQSSDNFLGVITPYRLEVVQGNVVTQEQVAAIRPGMSRAQVRDVLGSPLLTDPFHVDRWDYVFTIRRQGTAPQERHVVVHFDGERLERIEAGGELPTEQQFVDSIDTFKKPRKAPVLALTDEQVAALPRPAQPPASAPAPTGPARSYPPLEPNP